MKLARNEIDRNIDYLKSYFDQVNKFLVSFSSFVTKWRKLLLILLHYK